MMSAAELAKLGYGMRLAQKLYRSRGGAGALEECWKLERVFDAAVKEILEDDHNLFTRRNGDE